MCENRRFTAVWVAVILIFLQVGCRCKVIGASICQGNAEVLAPPLTVIDVAQVIGGAFPDPQGVAQTTVKPQVNHSITAITVDPLTQRFFAIASFIVSSLTPSGGPAVYTCDGLISAPQVARGDSSAVLISPLVNSYGHIATPARGLVPLDADVAGAPLRTVAFGSAYAPFGGVAYTELLRIRALVLTDAELLVVSQLQILVIARAALAADPTGASALVSTKLPLPTGAYFSFALDGGTGTLTRFDWTAAAWAPSQDRLYATSTTVALVSQSYADAYAQNALENRRVALFVFRRSGTWATDPVQLVLRLPPIPIFSTVCIVPSIAYLPPSNGTNGTSGGALAFICVPELPGSAVSARSLPWAGLLRANLSSTGIGIASAVMLAGHSGAEGTSSADGASAVGAWVTSFAASVLPLDATGVPGALLLSGVAGSRIVWPNGTLGTVAGASIATAVPVVAGLAVPLPTAGSDATTAAFVTSVGMYICRPRMAAAACPVGQLCTIFSPPQSPTLIGCPRRFFCPAGSLAMPPLNGSSIMRTTGMLPCPAGAICVENTTTPAVCPAGSQCGQNATHDIIVSCPPKLYCPAGTRLDGGSVCASGVLCPGGAQDRWGRPTGGLCPAGSVCRDNEQLPCPAGGWCAAGTEASVSSHLSWNQLPCQRIAALPVNWCRDNPDNSNCTAGLSVGFRILPGNVCGCPPGYLCPEGSSRPDALLCPAGMACPADSAYPAGGCAPGFFCPEGSTNVIGTSVLREQGGKCGPGTYCPAGSPAPIVCPPGTYSSVSGRFLPCDQCPQGRWSALSSQTSNATCRQCPAGTTTSGSGAVSRDACAMLPFSCPTGEQPVRFPATSAADCGPLSCDRGLQLGSSGVGCEGCPPGTFGRPPQCSPCSNATHICPGMTAFPLPSIAELTSALATIRSSRGAKVPSSVAATGLLNDARALLTASDCAALADAVSAYWPASAPSAAPAPTSIGPGLAGEAVISIVAGTLGIIVLSCGCIAMRTPPPSASAAGSPTPSVVYAYGGWRAAKAAASTSNGVSAWQHRVALYARKAATMLDLFSLGHRVDMLRSPVQVPTPLGGTCSLLGIVTLLAIWAVLILQRAQNNVGRTVSFDAAGEEQLALAASSQRGSTASGVTGIHVIMAAAGEPGSGGCASLLSWKASRMYKGAFTHSVTTCGAVAQHVFACPDCIVTARSKLEAELPWSCQALLVQTLAASVDGQMTVRTVDAAPPTPEATDGSAMEVQLLSTVDVSVPPMLLLQNDTMKAGFPVTRGYRLLAGSASTTVRTVAVDAFAPSTASVNVMIDLQASGIYQDIQLFERVTLAQLLSSLLGTLGLLGVFGIVAKHASAPSGPGPVHLQLAASDFVSSGGFLGQAGGQGRPVGAAAAGADDAGRDSLFSVQSPLNRVTGVIARPAPQAQAASAPSQLAAFAATCAFDGKEHDSFDSAAAAASMGMSRSERVARSSYAPALAHLEPRSAVSPSSPN